MLCKWWYEANSSLTFWNFLEFFFFEYFQSLVESANAETKDTES